MTLLIASVSAGTGDELRTRVGQAFSAGADVAELRLDAIESLDDDLVQWAAGLPAGKWIATCRPASEGGASTHSARQRALMLVAIAEGAQGLIDFEFAHWRRSARTRARLADAVGTKPGAPTDSRLILSHHDFTGRPDDPRGILRMIAAEEGVIPKLAWMPESICDNFEALDLVRSSPGPVIVICMGEAGLPSRVLAPKVGAFATYCAPSEDITTAPGQATLAQMTDLYRWRRIGTDTRLFGVIGWPVAHSMSPLLHNAAFDRAGVDGVYLPLPIEPRDRVLEDFLDGCLANDWLDAAGFSVTVPHKSRVVAYLGDRVDELAGRIGAVNTLVVSDGGYRGYNTDYCGALDALTAGLGCERNDLRGTAIDLLGAGGAARAVVAGLREYGCDVTLSNIIPQDAATLAEEFGCNVRAWGERDHGTGSILVNCTSVGMRPVPDETPFPADALGRYEAVFDVVYNPMRTRLLGDAARAGCRVISGVEMFVNQAAEQFRLWTGREPDKGLMRDLVVRGLRKAGE
ncbi:MAG: shikimate dehydrogenase [Phycisphaerales bacterium]|nr:MAG: shikimate dehydrogenase [Phycisphaerales bacterium]